MGPKHKNGNKQGTPSQGRGKNSNSPKQSSSSSSDDVIGTVMANVKSVEQGAPLPQFKEVPDILEDPTSSLFGDADSIAEKVATVVSDPSSSKSQKEKKINKEKVNEAILKASTSVGIKVDESYIADLMSIAHSKGELSETDAWMYFRGVSMNTQISMTEEMKGLVKQLDAALTKCTTMLTTNSESNKVMVQKQASLSSKVDGIVHTVSNTINQGTEKVLGAIKIMESKVESSAAQKRTPTIEQQVSKDKKSEAGPSAPRPEYPTLEDLITMCDDVGLPRSAAESIDTKYKGKFTWRDREKVMSKSTTKTQIKELLESLKHRK